MYPIEILYIKVLNNFCNIDSLFIFEVLYEIKHILETDFQINAIYITSPLEKKNDQELELFTLPAQKIGKFKVILKIQPPNYNNFKVEEIMEITVILLIISYQKNELIRIGYYLNNEFLYENKTEQKNLYHKKNIIRKILSDKPRITYFPFNQRKI
jgi:histone chaperone ASF1